MRYQFNVIKNLIKSSFWKLFIVYIAFYACIYCVIQINSFEITDKDFYFLVGIITKDNGGFLEYLWILFQIICTTYMSWNYLEYDNNHSKEFLYLRKSFNRIFIEKLLILCTLILSVRIIIFGISYFILKKHVYFSINDFIKSIIIYSILPLFLILYKFIKRKYINKKL